ncbi:MAG: hypothetical protein ACK4ND_04990 [Cytophagaceae bacterium]
MKQAELILGALVLGAIAMSLLLLPLAGVILVLCLSSLSMMYMALSFALLNGIRLRKMFDSDSYKSISTPRIIGAVLTGFALSITAVGIMFKLLSWPGASANLSVGIAGLFIALVVGLVRFLNKRSPFYINLFKRIAVFGGLGLLLLLSPEYAWLKMKYREHPEYVEAIRQANADPTNALLQQRLKDEREKLENRNR